MDPGQVHSPGNNAYTQMVPYNCVLKHCNPKFTVHFFNQNAIVLIRLRLLPLVPFTIGTQVSQGPLHMGQMWATHVARV